MKRLIITLCLFIITDFVFPQSKLNNLNISDSEINKKDSLGKQGIWYIFYPNGNVTTIRKYKNDTLHGYFENYWSNGNLSDRGFYINGKLEGVFYFILAKW
jgi:antitoxin component YwqK of YwqJK toxin-antitoxin module